MHIYLYMTQICVSFACVWVPAEVLGASTGRWLGRSISLAYVNKKCVLQCVVVFCSVLQCVAARWLEWVNKKCQVLFVFEWWSYFSTVITKYSAVCITIIWFKDSSLLYRRIHCTYLHLCLHICTHIFVFIKDTLVAIFPEPDSSATSRW